MNNLSTTSSEIYTQNIFSLLNEGSNKNELKLPKKKISLKNNINGLKICKLNQSITTNKISPIFSRSISIRKKRKLVLNSGKRNLLSKENKEILNNEEKDVKNLTLWEQENINYKKQKHNILFGELKNIYTRDNSISKIKELENVSSIMYSSKTTNNILKKTPLITNSTLSKYYLQNKQNEGAILMNSISKTKSRFNKNLFLDKNKQDLSLFNFDLEALDSMKEENLEKTKDIQRDNQNDYYRKIVNEKIRQESSMRESLIKIANLISEKKDEKEKIKIELEELYKKKNKEDEIFFEERNKLKTAILKLEELYCSSNRFLIKSGTNLNKDTIYKNMSIKTTMWNNLEHKISELIEENKRKTEEFEKTKEEYNKKLQLINEEQGYLKFVYYTMVQNQRLYYFNILKSGYDVRYDGLVWCVKNLIEMNTNLEYFHFPKFLDHEQIDYLISQAKSLLLENLYNLTLRILKRKQNKRRDEQKQNEYKKLQIYVNERQNDRERKRKERKLNTKNYIFSKRKNDNSDIKTRIINSYNTIYNKYKDAFKLSEGIIDDEEQSNKIVNEIRESILLKGEYSNNEKENLILKFFEQDPKNKMVLKIILQLRKEINKIAEKRNEDRKKMIEKIKEREKNTDRYANPALSIEFDLIYSALFGTNMRK